MYFAENQQNTVQQTEGTDQKLKSIRESDILKKKTGGTPWRNTNPFIGLMFQMPGDWLNFLP